MRHYLKLCTGLVIACGLLGMPLQTNAQQSHIMTASDLEHEHKLDELFSALDIIDPPQNSDHNFSSGDRKKALSVIENLSDEGVADAQYYLAKLYSTRGIQAILPIETDQIKASQLYLAAAKQDHPDAMLETALRYEHGTGVAQDKALAMDWYQKVIKLPDNLYSHLTYTAGCKIDYLEDEKLDNRNCEEWTITR